MRSLGQDTIGRFIIPWSTLVPYSGRCSTIEPGSLSYLTQGGVTSIEIGLEPPLSKEHLS